MTTETLTPAATAQTVAPRQLESAWRLASAFGHLWSGALGRLQLPDGGAWPKGFDQESKDFRQAHYDANIYPEFVFVAPDHELTPGEIDNLTEEKYPDPRIGGIYSPHVAGNGDIMHETGTGRTVWFVGPEGAVDFHICRPGGRIVLEGRVGALFSPGSQRSVSLHPSGEYFERHLYAAGDVLRALVGPERAVAVCALLAAGTVESRATVQAENLMAPAQKGGPTKHQRRLARAKTARNLAQVG